MSGGNPVTRKQRSDLLCDPHASDLQIGSFRRIRRLEEKRYVKKTRR